MIWLGLRLGLTGRRSSLLSAIVLVVALMTGLTATLTSFGYAAGVGERADRAAWTEPFTAELRGLSTEAIPAVAYVNLMQDYFQDQPITVVSLAGSDGSAPIPPGLPSIPSAGQVYLSPALRALAEQSPRLAVRYGRMSGTVDDTGLASPTTLLAVRGVPLEVAKRSGIAVAAFGAASEPIPLQDPARLLPALMLLAVLVLTAVLAVLATRIGGSHRRDRLGRLRLLGASARQIRLIALAERLPAIVVGLAAGAGLFYAIRPLLARAWLGDGTFFVGDVTPNFATALTSGVLIAVLGLAATQAEMRRILADPTSSVRGGEAPVALRFRVAVALALLAGVVALSSPGSSGATFGRAPTLLLAAVAALGVLLLLGPWMVQRLGASLRRAGGVARLLAGRRQEGSPRSVFRATAGVAVAIVISIAYASVAPTAYAELSDQRVIRQQPDTVQIDVSDATPAQVDELAAQVAELAGVRAMASVSSAMTSSQGRPYTVWVGDCAQLVAAARLTGVPCGVAPALVAQNRLTEGFDPGRSFELYDYRPADAVGRNNETLYSQSSSLTVSYSEFAEMPDNTAVDAPDIILDRAAPGADFDDLRPSMLLVGHTGALDIEVLRTLAFQAVPNVQVATRATSFDGFNLELRTVRELVQALSLGLFALAGLSLLIAANASLIERRDAFLALREAGASRATILRALALESASPVVLTGLAGALVGIGVGQLLATEPLPVGPLILQALAGIALATLMSLMVLIPARRLTQPSQ